jgi:DNA-binding GntR family transcriptional regulator
MSPQLDLPRPIRRTPGRETMLRLASEGVFKLRHGRGFQLSPTGRDEVKVVHLPPDQVGPGVPGIALLPTVDCSPASEAQLRELDLLCNKMKTARKAEGHVCLVKLDGQRHDLLTHYANNRRLCPPVSAAEPCGAGRP